MMSRSPDRKPAPNSKSHLVKNTGALAFKDQIDYYCCVASTQLA
jgi:hypothetical protein